MEDNEGHILIIIIFIVLCIWLYIKLKAEKKEREKLARENAKLIADNSLLEAEHLKFQLQPHTLRNMVATLHVAAKNLYKGSEALAETLDYVLYQGNKHTHGFLWYSEPEFVAKARLHGLQSLMKSSKTTNQGGST